MLGEAVAIPHSASLRGHCRYRGALQRIFAELHRVLKPDGRLLFGYANREPAAWVNLFAALRDSGFRPLAYTILHSENELDYAKRNGRACNLDLILELAPGGDKVVEQWRPSPLFDTDEERFLMAVGDAFLDCTSMVNGWSLSSLAAFGQRSSCDLGSSPALSYNRLIPSKQKEPTEIPQHHVLALARPRHPTAQRRGRSRHSAV